MSVYVVFFGGYLSDQPAIDQWLASANNVCGGDVTYDAFPYPDGVGPMTATPSSASSSSMR